MNGGDFSMRGTMELNLLPFRLVGLDLESCTRSVDRSHDSRRNLFGNFDFRGIHLRRSLISSRKNEASLAFLNRFSSDCSRVRVSARTHVWFNCQVGVAIGILVAIGAFFCIRLCRKPRKLPINTNTRSISSLGRSISTVKSLSNTQTDNEPQLLAQKNPWSLWNRHAKDPFTSVSGILRYSYKDLQRATDNFTTVLGQGSFGPVFRATMPTNEVVAVKVLASDSKQGEREFHTEVFLLARLHHRNLVNLVGYCVDKGQKMLIYEYMSNGSLANHLYCENTSVLSWEERLQVALDISYGIEYLHEGASPPVIHRDLKSSNILLDQLMRAKVADFGLSKEEVFDGRNSCVKGTYGYMDPEYVSTKRFTKKSDIYSFGIILFELITAINPQQGLMDYIELAALSVDGASGWDEILDKKLVGKCNLEEVGQVASIAYKCVNKIPRKGRRLLMFVKPYQE